MKFLSIEKLGPHRFKTPEGYLICTDAIIARTGKQQYKKNELFEDSEDDESIIDVDRPYKEVFSDETIASGENKPLCDEHPDEDVNVDNHRDLAMGYMRDLHKGTDDGKDVLMANIVVTDPEVIAEIESGEKTELSCGYDCQILKDDNNNYYQSKIRINHLALCEKGRAGNARIQDSIKDAKGKNLVNLNEVLSKGEELARNLPQDKWAKETRKNYLTDVYYTYVRELKPIAVDGKVYSNDNLNEYELETKFISAALNGNLSSFFANEIKVETNAPRDWRNKATDLIDKLFKQKYKVKDSIEDSGFQEIGNFWRKLESKNPGISKLVQEFYKTPVYQHWDLKNSMDIIYSETMFNEFMKYYKQKTGKEMITDTKDSIEDAYYGPNDNVLSKDDALKELKTARINDGDYWDAGQPKEGWYIQIQAPGMRTHEEITKYPRVSPKESSYAWGRIWNDGKFEKEFKGQLNVVRQDMIRYLQSIHDSVEDEYYYSELMREIKCKNNSSYSNKEIYDAVVKLHKKKPYKEIYDCMLEVFRNIENGNYLLDSLHTKDSINEDDFKSLHKDSINVDDLEDKPVKVRIRFENNKEANDALRMLQKSRDFIDCDLIFDDTIQVKTSKMYVEDLKKKLKLYFIEKIDVIDSVKDSKYINMSIPIRIENIIETIANNLDIKYEINNGSYIFKNPKDADIIIDKVYTRTGIKLIKSFSNQITKKEYFKDSINVADIKDAPYFNKGRRIPAHNTYRNRISQNDLLDTFEQVMKTGSDEDVDILIGQLTELKKDYLADINDKDLDADETKKYYSKYKNIVKSHLNSKINQKYTKAVNEFVNTIKDSVSQENKFQKLINIVKKVKAKDWSMKYQGHTIEEVFFSYYDDCHYAVDGDTDKRNCFNTLEEAKEYIRSLKRR